VGALVIPRHRISGKEMVKQRKIRQTENFEGRYVEKQKKKTTIQY
jgi:hypothetical protein